MNCKTESQIDFNISFVSPRPQKSTVMITCFFAGKPGS